MCAEELAAEEESEYPVYKLHETAGPSFSESALYGPMGRIAKIICENSEANCGTVYLNLIVSFGSIFGRGPYFNVDGTKHYCNENVANIGDTSKGRKGTSSDAAEVFLRLVASSFMSSRNMGGFASSQAVIELIKDASSYQRRNKKTGAYDTIVVPGVMDKRLCLRESELSNVFKLISDPKTKAGELFRNAFDGKELSNKVAGKTDDGEHRSLLCREPHVSIIGSSTASLTKANLPVGSDTSGDGNRFIWNYTKRTQLCPFGGPSIDWAAEKIEYAGVSMLLLVYIQKMIEEASEARLIPFTKAARKFWDHLYQRLETDKRAGFLVGMTSRATAHIRRLAMILCLTDRENSIDVKHLKAAEAIWDHSQESAQFIFTGYSLDQRKILQFVNEKGDGIKLTDVHNLFKRNKSAGWIRAQVRSLVDGGFLTATPDGIYKFKKW